MSEKIDKDKLLSELEERMEKLTVAQLMMQMAANLANLAFKHLGASDEKKEFRDLKQAKLAIDGLSALNDLLRDELKKEEADFLASALTNLRFLYVEETQSDSAEATSEKKEKK
jgi:uncharacterized protein YcbK (DUF882 family)